MPFYHFHSFVCGAIIMSTELFLGSIPVRFYHFTFSIGILLVYCLIQYAMDQSDLHLFPIWDDSRLVSSSRNKLKEAILTGIFLGFLVHVFLFSLSAIKVRKFLFFFMLFKSGFIGWRRGVTSKTNTELLSKRGMFSTKNVKFHYEKILNFLVFSNPKAKLQYISRVAGMLANAGTNI